MRHLPRLGGDVGGSVTPSRSDAAETTVMAALPRPWRARLAAKGRRTGRGLAHRTRYAFLRGLNGADLGPRLFFDAQPGGSVRVGARFVSLGDLTLSVSGDLRVGDDVFFGRGCLVSCMVGVTVGDRVRLGERVSIHDANHLFEPLGAPELATESYKTSPVVLGDRVWLGANCVVLPGVTIGADTVVGAGSVVTRSLPAGVLAAGQPARVIRELTAVPPADVRAG